jgi:hypothetical protein
MLRRKYDAKVTRKLAVMRIVFALIGLVACVAILGFYLWRLQNFERSVATVEAVWDEEVNRRGTTIVTMAELSFSRTAPMGEAIACRHQFEIGTPRDGFKVGDKLDIVPATGTCQGVDITGRSGVNP